jgi:sulfate transport system ATP-binding protein
MTTVLVTHDQEEALEVSDRVVVMNQARIEQVGTPAEVFHQPATEFVIDFLGKVNVFHGRIEQGRAVLSGVRVDIGGRPLPDTAQANVYVRPHELEIERQVNGESAILARVARINPAGSLAKIVLAEGDGREIQVDLSLDRYRELSLVPGEQVYVLPKQVRVFAPDYCI